MDTLENGSANGREGVCLLRMREIMDRTTLSRPVLGRMIKDKLFPSGCRNGREHPRWSDRDVTAWQVSRMDARAGVLRLAEPVTLQPRKGMEPEEIAPVPRIQMLRRAEVARRVGLGKTQIYRRIRSDGFPAPVPISPGRRAWVEHEIDAWIEKRIEQSRDDPSSGPNDPDQGDDLSR